MKIIETATFRTLRYGLYWCGRIHKEEFMKVTGKMFGILVVLMFVLAVSTVCAGGQSEKAGEGEMVYVNGIDADFPPFAYIDEKGNPAGFDVESVDWIAEEMGFEVKHQPTAWDGIVESLLAGKIDFVASGMSITEERKERISFTVPYWETDLAVAVQADADISFEEALAGDYKIGVQRGTTAQMWLEDNLVASGQLDQKMIVIYDSFSLAVKDLLNGRVDAAMQDATMVEDAAAVQPIKVVGAQPSGEAYAYGVRKEDNELREMLSEGIKRLQASPKWEELKEKYEL